MKTQATDIEIRSEIRSLLARRRFDMSRLQFRVAGGTVRMGGELAYHGVADREVQRSVVECFEREVSTSCGVRHAYMDFDNWRRLSTGDWEEVRVRSMARIAAVAA